MKQILIVMLGVLLILTISNCKDTGSASETEIFQIDSSALDQSPEAP